MKKKTSSPADLPQTNRVPANSAALSRGTLLFRRLRSALEGFARRQFRYEDLAELIGEPKSTLCNWNNGDGQPASEALLRVLELLPPARRNEILAELPFCRSFPTIEHPRISHDPVASSFLTTMLSNQKGMSIVYGDRDALNTFVATAMGHSFLLLAGNRGQVAGLDIHAPDWFVPVPGVTYLNNVSQPSRIRQEFETAWPQFCTLKPKLVILNGFWATLPELKLGTCELAKSCHLIVTDVLQTKIADLPSLPAPAQLVRVAQDGRDSERIRLDIKVL